MLTGCHFQELCQAILASGIWPTQERRSGNVEWLHGGVGLLLLSEHSEHPRRFRRPAHPSLTSAELPAQDSASDFGASLADLR
jgi:hypothetical protein